MDVLLFILVFILVSVTVGSIVSFALFLAAYLTHISMNKDDNPKVIRMITFKKFITMVNSFHCWEQQSRHPTSLFGDGEYYHKWYVHASIIKLDGEHFIFWPHSYVAFKIWESRLGNKAKSYKFYWR